MTASNLTCFNSNLRRDQFQCILISTTIFTKFVVKSSRINVGKRIKKATMHKRSKEF